MIERGDWRTHRERGNIGQAYLASLVSSSPDVRLTSFSTVPQDGTPIELRWYTKKNATPCSAVVYVHEDGKILGSLDMYDAVASAYVTGTGVSFLSVNYRLAPNIANNYDRNEKEMLHYFICYPRKYRFSKTDKP